MRVALFFVVFIFSTGWAETYRWVDEKGTAKFTQDYGSIPEEYRDHAWFVAFAPVDNPEIAVAVFVEHGGHGGSAAAPIARNVIEKYFNCKLGKAECADKEPEAPIPDAGA